MRYFQSARVCLFSFMLAIWIGGCGGGGGNSGGGGTGGTPYPLASRLRMLQPGDAWHYTAAVVQTAPVGDSFPATADATITNVIVGGQTLLSQTNIFNGGGQTLSTALYYKQDPATSDLILVGGAANPTLPAPTVTVPGAWNAGESFTRLIPGSQPGTDITFSFNILGSEIVTVPAGTFYTWKVAESQTQIGSFVTSGTYWFAPQIGTYVKAVYSTGLTGGAFSGQSYTYTVQMVSTTVPLQ